MPSFKLAASSVKVKHKHIAYLNDDGSGMTTVEKDHQHPIVMEAQMTAVIDPMTGQPIMQQTGVMQKMLEVNGHTHELKDLDLKQPKPKEEKKEIVDQVHKLFKKSESYSQESRDNAYENERYYCNEQWTKDDRRALEGQSRPALTINLSQAAIKSLSGYQRNNRTDLKFFPVEEGDALVADILTEISKIILEGCNYPLEETESFFQTLVAGVGYLNMYVSYDKNIKGEIIVEQFDWRDTFPGQHNKKDFSDLDHLEKVKWYSKEQLSNIFPEKKKEIDAIFEKYSDDDSKTLMKSPKSTGTIEQPDGYQIEPGTYTAENIDILNKNIRMIECWRKEYVRKQTFVDRDTEFVLNLDEWPEAEAKSLKTIGPQINLIERISYKMRVTKVACDVLLDDEYPTLAINDFHIIPIYAEKVRDRVLSKMDFVKDLQDETNKRLSTMADILNKVNAYGVYYDEEMFDTRDDMEEFEGKYSTPGFMQKVRDVSRRPIKEEGVKYPAELERVTMTMMNLFDRLMNVNPELMGQQGNTQSGVAQIQKIKQALMGNEYLFDNLSLAKKKMGKILVHMIQEVYDAERIYRILNNQAKKNQIEIGGQPFEKYSREEIIGMLQNKDLTKYDVMTEESASSPSMMYANFLLLSDLAGKGLPIPVTLLMEMAPIPESSKQKAMQMVQQQQQQQAQQEQKKYDTEIQKTLIAKGEGQSMGNEPMV